MPLHEEKHVVVIDLGYAYTKCGFAGEPEPRVIVPSAINEENSSRIKRIHDFSSSNELYRNLVKFLHKLYFKHLLVNHRDRRIVIVESLLTTSVFRETLAEVLFVHFEVPAALFAPSHLVSLYTLGISTGLVLDVGFKEAVLVPVVEGTPLIHAHQAQPLAAEAIHKRIESLLKLQAKVRTASGEEQSVPESAEWLDADVLEDITVRTCFVTDFSRGRQILEAKTSDSGPAPPVYPPDVVYPVNGSTTVIVPGSIREEAAEILFELDNEMVSLASMILDAILECPIDSRVSLAENLVIIGGLAMMPGFQARLLAEVKHLQNSGLYQNKISLKSWKLHRPPAKRNYVAWLGGAILGATEIVATKSLAREVYMIDRHLPDWVHLRDTAKETERAG